MENKPITIYGSGEQTRSFQYVSDLVAGLVALMKSDYTQPVNIGNPEERSINSFAALIRDLVPGSGSRIVHKPAVEDDPQRRQSTSGRKERGLDMFRIVVRCSFVSLFNSAQPKP